MRLLLPFLLIGMSACGSSSADSGTTTKSCSDKSLKGSLVVMAASSMANVFTDMQSSFLDDHPCITDITFSYGSSATLAAQIVNGSPADVFISASEATMITVKNAGKTLSVDLFAKNVGEIMVSLTSKFVGRITDIGSLVDAVNPGIKIGLCVATAPCGSLSNTILKNAGSTRGLVADTESPSVEDLVTKIEMGELDAGIVFHSDCVSTQKRKSSKCISIPTDVNATNSYYVAALNSRNVTQQFVDFVSSPTFTTSLQSKYGFLAP